MVKIISQTLLGLAFAAFGFYVGYVAILEPDQSKSFLMLVPATMLIITGTILLYKAGKSDEMIMSRANKKYQNLTLIAKTSPVETLKKNNTLITQWRKINQQRDRLRMLQIASSDEK